MSDQEFELLDELYFVQSYQYLKEALGWQDQLILDTLNLLYRKGFIKCLDSPDEERFDDLALFEEGKDLFYLATKKGLMAHNAL